MDASTEKGCGGRWQVNGDTVTRWNVPASAVYRRAAGRAIGRTQSILQHAARCAILNESPNPACLTTQSQRGGFPLHADRPKCFLNHAPVRRAVALRTVNLRAHSLRPTSRAHLTFPAQFAQKSPCMLPYRQHTSRNLKPGSDFSYGRISWDARQIVSGRSRSRVRRTAPRRATGGDRQSSGGAALQRDADAAGVGGCGPAAVRGWPRAAVAVRQMNLGTNLRFVAECGSLA